MRGKWIETENVLRFGETKLEWNDNVFAVEIIDLGRIVGRPTFGAVWIDKRVMEPSGIVVMEGRITAGVVKELEGLDWEIWRMDELEGKETLPPVGVWKLDERKVGTKAVLVALPPMGERRKVKDHSAGKPHMVPYPSFEEIETFEYIATELRKKYPDGRAPVGFMSLHDYATMREIRKHGTGKDRELSIHQYAHDYVRYIRGTRTRLWLLREHGFTPVVKWIDMEENAERYKEAVLVGLEKEAVENIVLESEEMGRYRVQEFWAAEEQRTGDASPRAILSLHTHDPYSAVRPSLDAVSLTVVQGTRFMSQRVYWLNPLEDEQEVFREIFEDIFWGMTVSGVGQVLGSNELIGLLTCSRCPLLHAGSEKEILGDEMQLGSVVGPIGKETS